MSYNARNDEIRYNGALVSRSCVTDSKETSCSPVVDRLAAIRRRYSGSGARDTSDLASSLNLKKIIVPEGTQGAVPMLPL
jgi:hypothetical protein